VRAQEACSPVIRNWGRVEFGVSVPFWACLDGALMSCEAAPVSEQRVGQRSCLLEA
jgi:hypothetical protein